MIISGKQALAYDIKVFKNAFFCNFVDTESDYVETYEISERINQIRDMVGVFMCPDYIFCGYNTIHYSIPIINFIIENYRSIPSDYSMICSALYNLSQTIITSEDFSEWSRWKHTKYFLTLDFYTMLASSKNRVGLKEIQITSDYPVISELFNNPKELLVLEKFQQVIDCSINDAKSIKFLCSKCEGKIRLREKASSKYNINLMSKDDVSMGLEIVKKFYLERTGLEWAEIKDKKSPKEIIALKDCIPEFLEFKTPVLKELIKELNNTVININDKKQFEKHFLLDDVEISFGMGGVHSIVSEDIITPNEDEELISVDTTSMYPTFILKYEVIPNHINKSAFKYIFNDIYMQRIAAKKADDEDESYTLKNALNSIIGNYRVYSSWLYAPECAVKTNISCQLFILKLAEMLIEHGITIKQINTDGIVFITKKEYNYKKEILDVWEGLTLMNLEIEKFVKIFQCDINNYLALHTDGTTKKKGLFVDEHVIGKGMKPKIIARAVNSYFINGIEPKVTIKNSNDIRDFITYQKVDKAYSVEYNDKIILRINRYYASVNGCSLYKCKLEDGQTVQSVIVHFKDGTYLRVPKTAIEEGGEYFHNPKVSHFEYNAGFVKLESRKLGYENLLKLSGVTLANNLDDIKEFPKNINYIYYIAEAKKIISNIENRQLSLF